jgi:hypothetical protein
VQHNREILPEARADGPHPRTPVEGIGRGDHVDQAGVVRRSLYLLVKLPVQPEEPFELAVFR